MLACLLTYLPVPAPNKSSVFNLTTSVELSFSFLIVTCLFSWKFPSLTRILKKNEFVRKTGLKIIRRHRFDSQPEVVRLWRKMTVVQAESHSAQENRMKPCISVSLNQELPLQFPASTLMFQVLEPPSSQQRTKANLKLKGLKTTATLRCF